MNANDILLWMSAKRSGSWAGYKDTLEEMAAVSEDGDDDTIDFKLPVYQRVRFNLERLAHVEFHRPDCPNGWCVVPPTIAIASDAAIGLLCGARTDQLLADLKQQVPEIRLTSQTECPDRIELFGVADLERFGIDCGFLIQHDATESLLGALPPVDEWQLRTSRELPFGNDASVSRFCASKLEWEPSSPDEAREASFGLFRWPVLYEQHYYLKQHRQAYQLPVQIGKYLILRHERQSVLTFDPSAQTLTVPVACRPPMLIDRALTLRTGLIPEVRQGSLIYQNITRSIAMTTVALLRQ